LCIAGYNRERDEFRRRRFELDGRAFRNEESEDSTPGSGDSSSTEENDELEPSQEIAPVLGVPIHSPDLFPGQVVGHPIYSPDLFSGQVVGYPFHHSLVFVPGCCPECPSTSYRVSTLVLTPETAVMFVLAFILTRLCAVIAFHALAAARHRRLYPF